MKIQLHYLMIGVLFLVGCGNSSEDTSDKKVIGSISGMVKRKILLLNPPHRKYAKRYKQAEKNTDTMTMKFLLHKDK